jgi:hypothetical protein
MDEQHVARYLEASAAAGTKVNTDDNGYLEYATPFEFLYETKSIIEALKPFAGWDRARLTGAEAQDLAAVDRLFAERQAKLLDELARPVE